LLKKAIKKRIRPERALSMSVTAAHMGITASPVSAASAALLTVLAASGIKLADILLICIPSTLIGVMAGILFVLNRGKELSEDPEFLERMKDPAFAKNLDLEENQMHQQRSNPVPQSRLRFLAWPYSPLYY
jgi:anaerobic C4-dicarboxylate transporter DcuA